MKNILLIMLVISACKQKPMPYRSYYNVPKISWVDSTESRQSCDFVIDSDYRWEKNGYDKYRLVVDEMYFGMNERYVSGYYLSWPPKPIPKYRELYLFTDDFAKRMYKAWMKYGFGDPPYFVTMESSDTCWIKYWYIKMLVPEIVSINNSPIHDSLSDFKPVK